MKIQRENLTSPIFHSYFYCVVKEFANDRHNMMLFLERDTRKVRPVGYDIQHRNIFDPADDIKDESAQTSDDDDNACSSEDELSKDCTNLSRSDTNSEHPDDASTSRGSVSSTESFDENQNNKYAETDSNKSGQKLVAELNTSINANVILDDGSTGVLEDNDDIKRGGNSELKHVENKPHCPPDSSSDDDSASESTIPARSGKKESEGPPKSCCVRIGCDREPRFDSLFCSDACGVSALETDLMWSLEYADMMHPSLLRSKSRQE